MRNPRSLFSAASALAFLLAACAAPNPYRPYSDGLGYTEAMVGPDHYEIAYHGTTDQDQLTAKKYAIVRAAEIAKAGGFPYFRLEDKRTREQEDKEVIKESEAVRDDTYPGRPWGHRVRTRSITRTEKKPVVKIYAAMQKDRCGDCMETEAVLSEAMGSGILGK